MKADKSPHLHPIEAVFAAEAMAHVKHLWFAKTCRAAGDDAAARVFEDAAAQEVQRAFGHAQQLFAHETMQAANQAAKGVVQERVEERHGNPYWSLLKQMAA